MSRTKLILYGRTLLLMVELEQELRTERGEEETAIYLYKRNKCVILVCCSEDVDLRLRESVGLKVSVQLLSHICKEIHRGNVAVIMTVNIELLTCLSLKTQRPFYESQFCRKKKYIKGHPKL